MTQFMQDVRQFVDDFNARWGGQHNNIDIYRISEDDAVIVPKDYSIISEARHLVEMLETYEFHFFISTRQPDGVPYEVPCLVVFPASEYF